MGANKLDVRYGDRSSLPYYNGILNYAQLSDADIVSAIRAGRVMSLTTGKLLVPGILASATADGGPIPYYAWSGLDLNNYPDVQRDRGMPGYYDKPTGGVGGPASPGFYGIPVSAGLVGGFATIQHTAAAELSSTAYDQTTGATYAPGDPLTAISAAATGAGGVSGTEGKTVRGLLRPVENATDVVVGYVAPAATFVGPEGYNVLAFTPAYVPGTTVPDTEVVDD
jgi:hypothetical protein